MTRRQLEATASSYGALAASYEKAAKGLQALQLLERTSRMGKHGVQNLLVEADEDELCTKLPNCCFLRISLDPKAEGFRELPATDSTFYMLHHPETFLEFLARSLGGLR